MLLILQRISKEMPPPGRGSQISRIIRSGQRRGVTREKSGNQEGGVSRKLSGNQEGASMQITIYT